MILDTKRVELKNSALIIICTNTEHTLDIHSINVAYSTTNLLLYIRFLFKSKLKQTSFDEFSSSSARLLLSAVKIYRKNTV